jgi:hypothetical protein
LKEKVDSVLAKGATLEAGKLNNYDLEVVIQWFKRDGDKSMPNNKEVLLLCYHETHTRVANPSFLANRDKESVKLKCDQAKI